MIYGTRPYPSALGPPSRRGGPSGRSGSITAADVTTTCGRASSPEAVGGAGCGFTWEHGALVLDPPTAEGRLPPARPSYGRLRARHPDCGRTSAVVALAGKPYWVSLRLLSQPRSRAGTSGATITLFCAPVNHPQPTCADTGKAAPCASDRC